MYDVAVVGYGPVGQLAALLLGRRGHRVAVYERRPEPHPLPRAVHVDDEVMRVFQSAGVAGEVAAVMDAPITYEWHNAAGEVLLAFDLTGVGPHGFPASNMFCQPDLEAVLDRAVRSLPNVDLHRGVRVTGLEDGGDGVTVSVDGASGGRARYVLGCDGAGSTVRDHVSPAVTDLDFVHDWLVVDVVPIGRREWDPPALQVCDPARPTTAVPGGPGRRRFEFMRLPGESRADLEREETVWRLLAPWGMAPASCTLARHAVYTFRAAWAERWRRGRVLLAGDAAHQMPPFAGQGLAAGVRDVANLTWKLDLVLAGRADPVVLDTYASERLAHLRLATTISVELGRVICVLDPDEAARRDAGMLAARASGAQTVAPPPSPGIGEGLTRKDDPVAGQPFPQGIVGRERRRFDDVAGPGALLVVAEGDAPVSGQSDVRVVHIGRLGDVGGTYGRWFAERGLPAVLVRPDRYVYGGAHSPAAATDLVREWSAALSGPVRPGAWNAALAGSGDHPDARDRTP